MTRASSNTWVMFKIFLKEMVTEYSEPSARKQMKFEKMNSSPFLFSKPSLNIASYSKISKNSQYNMMLNKQTYVI